MLFQQRLPVLLLWLHVRCFSCVTPALYNRQIAFQTIYLVEMRKTHKGKTNGTTAKIEVHFRLYYRNITRRQHFRKVNHRFFWIWGSPINCVLFPFLGALLLLLFHHQSAKLSRIIPSYKLVHTNKDSQNEALFTICLRSFLQWHEISASFQQRRYGRVVGPCLFGRRQDECQHSKRHYCALWC